MAPGYFAAATARTPASGTSPKNPSLICQPMMNSHLPSFGKPANWQLQPCWQLHASTLSAFIRYGVLGSVTGIGCVLQGIFGVYPRARAALCDAAGPAGRPQQAAAL